MLVCGLTGEVHVHVHEHIVQVHRIVGRFGGENGLVNVLFGGKSLVNE